jgi:PAS domain S-box-containing protein
MSNEALAEPGDNTLAHALMDAAVDAVIVIDEQGIIGECSRSSAELFGYSQEFLMGKMCRY